MFDTILSNLIPRLDAELTGKDISKAIAKFQQHPILIDKFVFGELYYLSDGGYSRFFFNFEEQKLILTDSSLDKSKQHWSTAQDLIAKIETICINYIEWQEENEASSN